MTHPHTPADAGGLAAGLQDLADEVAHLLAVRRNDAADAAELAARLAVLEQTAAIPEPADGGGYPYRYEALADWVDEVFARLAAAHRAKWCTSWHRHAEARIRLEVLWHTWESAMAAPEGGDPNWSAVDEWIRLRLDHHAGVLLEVDGPFAGCVPSTRTDPGRCSLPPALTQRPLVPDRSASLALLEAHRARRRGPVGSAPSPVGSAP
jgi:Domain of unknown function (DUF4913)